MPPSVAQHGGQDSGGRARVRKEVCGGCLKPEMPSIRASNPSLNMAPRRPVCPRAVAGPYCHHAGGRVREDARWQAASVPPVRQHSSRCLG